MVSYSKKIAAAGILAACGMGLVAVIAAETPPVKAPKAEAPAKAPKAEPPVKAPKAEAPVKAPEEAPAKAPKTEVVASGLDNPSGVAIQEGTGHLFIASHPGIFRIDPKKPGKAVPEITGFKTDIYGKGPKYEIGPLGVAFIDDHELVVADGSNPDAEEVVLVYKVGKEAPATPATADSAEKTLGPIKAGEASAKGEGNFYAIAVGDHAMYITSNGDDTKGWILKVAYDDDKIGDLEPFIATKVAVNVDAPVGITITDEGEKGQLVVGQMGEINVPGDSLLSFYDPEDGHLLRNYKTGLNDIAGLAYSPSGKLYAVDFSWIKPEDGGLFRLDINGEECKATKIVGLDKPTSLTFDDDGNLYITVFNSKKEGATEPAGAVLKIDKKAKL